MPRNIFDDIFGGRPKKYDVRMHIQAFRLGNIESEGILCATVEAAGMTDKEVEERTRQEIAEEFYQRGFDDILILEIEIKKE